AMGDHGAMIGEPRRLQACATFLEQFAQRATIDDAVDAPAPVREVAPVQGCTGKAEDLIDIEAAGAAAELLLVSAIDRTGVEEPMDRLGFDLRRVGRVEGRQIALANAAVEGALRIDERRRGGAIQFHSTAEVGEARLAAATVEQDLAADLAGRMQRQIDRETGIAQHLGPVVLADRVGLAFLLVELEEEGAPVARRHEAVERIEAVAVAVDLD